jgi:MYXO-CTERM domain-containing protein
MPTRTGPDRVTSGSPPQAASFNERFLQAGVPSLAWLIGLWMAYDLAAGRGTAAGGGPMRWGLLAMGLLAVVYPWARRRDADARWEVLTLAAVTLMFAALALG